MSTTQDYQADNEQAMIDQAPTYTGVLTNDDCTSYIWWKPAVELEGYLTRTQPEDTYDISNYEYVGPDDVNEAFRLGSNGRVRSRGHETLGVGARAITTSFHKVSDLNDLTPGDFYELTVSASDVVEALESAVAEIETGLPEGIDIGVVDIEYEDGVATCDLYVSNADTEAEIVTEVTITPQDIDEIDGVYVDCSEDGIHWEITTSGDSDIYFLVEESLGSIPGMLTKDLPEAVDNMLAELGDAA